METQRITNSTKAKFNPHPIKSKAPKIIPPIYQSHQHENQSGAAMRYYSTLRPVSIGTFPDPDRNCILEIENFEKKRYCEEIGRDAWGYIDYSSPLSQKDIDDYELIPGNTNAELKPCPFCGSNNLYFDSITDDIGTENPIIFCNSCKIEFHVENDSPYADDESTKAYLHEKNIKAWNNRA